MLTFQSTIVSFVRTVIGKAEFFFETFVEDSAFAFSTIFDIRRSTFNVENSTIIGHGWVKPFDNFSYVDLGINDMKFLFIFFLG